MSRIARFYFQRIDRSLGTPVSLNEKRSELNDGEWSRFLGELGEQLAVKFLRRKGMKPLYRNFRAPQGGEVDIVCRDGDTLVFLEVKTRRTTDFGRPVRAVDRGKQSLIIRGALAWLRELNHPDVIFRFDVVEVVLEEGKPPQVEHLKHVFEMPESIRY